MYLPPWLYLGMVKGPLVFAGEVLCWWRGSPRLRGGRVALEEPKGPAPLAPIAGLGVLAPHHARVSGDQHGAAGGTWRPQTSGVSPLRAGPNGPFASRGPGARLDASAIQAWGNERGCPPGGTDASRRRTRPEGAVIGRRHFGACIAVALLWAAPGFAALAQGDRSVPTGDVVAEATVMNVAGDVPMSLALIRATLPPGGALRPRTLTGPVLVVVQEGVLVVGGPRRQWAGGTSRVRAGGQAVVPAGARVRLRNGGETPTTFLILSLEPSE